MFHAVPENKADRDKNKIRSTETTKRIANWIANKTYGGNCEPNEKKKPEKDTNREIERAKSVDKRKTEAKRWRVFLLLSRPYL